MTNNLKSQNELLKESSPTLAGNIAQTLADAGATSFSDDDNQFLKFHGIYQQDDRDLRKTGKKFIMMIRLRVPGGVLTPAQYLELDRLSTQYGNNTLRVTSRQTLQFHSVLKSNLRATVKGINDALLTTIAACGDVVRNVTASPSPASDGVREHILAEARKLSAALAPRTPAYHSIWIDGKALDLADENVKNFVDPLYGKSYLPRKFKIAFAIPPVNDVDVFANDAGLIAIVEGGKLIGFNLAAGGGMGRSHGNDETFPRVADVIGFLTPDQVEQTVRAVVTIHRDFGDRANRKHARLKYLLADRGVEWFRTELEQRLGFKLAPARPFSFTKQGDAFGWHEQADGNWFLGLFVETGRIKDTERRQMKTALRKIVEQFRPEVRLTPGNNVLLANVRAEQREAITALLAVHGISVARQGSAVRCASMACVSLPTCGLGLAESERYLPDLITRIEGLLGEVSLGDEEIIIRMTGCPNGCARPYMAEIGFVGKAPGKYQIWLGGNEASTRLNRLWKDIVKDADVIAELRPLLGRYAQERRAGERFGDWVARVLWAEQPAAN
ncbi:MAG: NADPH-dependent assimilatory sulfite reductase hemoprotein subunit [Verrucomicrobia bacterium]|nr:NADPH-dependent assimilatory sulfite reductase hemoprotein subunit [Verrucomicrobiota bacterium]